MFLLAFVFSDGETYSGLTAYIRWRNSHRLRPIKCNEWRSCLTLTLRFLSFTSIKPYQTDSRTKCKFLNRHQFWEKGSKYWYLEQIITNLNMNIPSLNTIIVKIVANAKVRIAKCNLGCSPPPCLNYIASVRMITTIFIFLCRTLWPSLYSFVVTVSYWPAIWLSP